MNIDLWQLLQCTELLKSKLPNISGEVYEHWGKAVFVANKVGCSMFCEVLRTSWTK